MLRYDQILPRNGQLLQDVAKIWVGMQKYGQIVPYYANIWSNLSCHALKYWHERSALQSVAVQAVDWQRR